MKTFSELAECLARIPPKITLYGRLFEYNYVGRLLLLMFSTDLLFAIKRDVYIFKETGWFCRFPKPQKLDKSGRWLEKSGKHDGPNFTLKPNTKARSLQFCKTEVKILVARKREISDGYMAYLSTEETSAITQNKSRAGERFIYETHSFMSVSFYTYLCMSVFTTSFGWY